jgi:hypothetical protein
LRKKLENHQAQNALSDEFSGDSDFLLPGMQSKKKLELGKNVPAAQKSVRQNGGIHFYSKGHLFARRFEKGSFHLLEINGIPPGALMSIHFEWTQKAGTKGGIIARVDLQPGR